MSNTIETTRPDLANLPAAPTAGLPEGTEVRGFALYVGVTPEQLGADTKLTDLVNQLKAHLSALAPSATSYAALALAPQDLGGSNLDITRIALGEPAARASRNKQRKGDPKSGVVIDLSRQQILLDGELGNLTYREFELLQFFILREGQTLTREDVIAGLWADSSEAEVPGPRTIDVHIRRLRTKLGAYHGIVRTVRGSGYRYDFHADVRVVSGPSPSPDLN